MYMISISKPQTLAKVRPFPKKYNKLIISSFLSLSLIPKMEALTPFFLFFWLQNHNGIAVMFGGISTQTGEYTNFFHRFIHILVFQF